MKTARSKKAIESMRSRETAGLINHSGSVMTAWAEFITDEAPKPKGTKNKNRKRKSNKCKGKK